MGDAAIGVVVVVVVVALLAVPFIMGIRRSGQIHRERRRRWAADDGTAEAGFDTGDGVDGCGGGCGGGGGGGGD